MKADQPDQPSTTSPRRRNPNWKRAELVLALELYLSAGILDDLDESVVELSDLLNSLDLHERSETGTKFRNANGVSMKLVNFASLDPSYSGRGLVSTGAATRDVWEEFRGDLDAVEEAARAIRGGYLAFPDTMNTGPVVADVPLERHLTKQFEVSGFESSSRERREQALVVDFGALLSHAGRSVLRHTYQLPSGGMMACDIFDSDTGVLYEAKSDVSRTSIRMAVGQLLDYRRFEPPGTRLAVLLPKAPSPDSLVYLRSLEIGVVYADPSAECGFTSAGDVKLLP